MSQTRPPRRRRADQCVEWAILACLATLVGAPLVTLTPASAQTQIEERNRDSSARTTVGSPGAARCSEAAAAGVSDDAAVEACDRAINSERLNRANRIATHLNRGAVHLRRSEGAAALIDFDAVLEMQPQNAEAHLSRGAALIMTGQPGPAVAAITTALSLGVREPHKAYYNRAAAREALGDLRGAYEDYSTALEIVPDWGPAEAELNRFVRNRRELLAERIGQPASTTAQQR